MNSVSLNLRLASDLSQNETWPVRDDQLTNLQRSSNRKGIATEPSRFCSIKAIELGLA